MYGIKKWGVKPTDGGEGTKVYQPKQYRSRANSERDYENETAYEAFEEENAVELERAPGDFTTPQEIIDAYRVYGNLALVLPDTKLTEIATAAWEGFEEDEASRSSYISELKQGMKMLLSEGYDARNHPIKKSNTNYPLLAKAAIAFAAHALPILLPDDTVAHPDLPLAEPSTEAPDIPQDAPPEVQQQLTAEYQAQRQQYDQLQDIADNQAELINQILFKRLKSWYRDTDRLLMALAPLGCYFRYHDVLEHKGNITEIVSPIDFVTDYNWCGGLDDNPRYSWQRWLSPVTVRQAMARGEYRDIENLATIESQRKNRDKVRVIHQYCFLDLDGDGYEEPYCVVFTHDTDGDHVLRIDPCYTAEGVAEVADEDSDEPPELRVVNIDRLTYFACYEFLPHPGGKFYGLGLIHLLRRPVDSINTLLNQMLDAGRLANTSGGMLSSDVAFNQGVVTMANGEWTVVQNDGLSLRDNILPNPHKEPSSTLFQLTEFLIAQAESLASMETVSFDAVPNNMGETVALSILQEGGRVKSAALKRAYNSLQGEIDILCQLGRVYGDDEVRELFAQGQMVRPIADPESAGSLQRAQKAMMLADFREDPVMDPVEVRKDMLQAGGIRDGERYFAKPSEPDPVQQAMVQLQIAEAENKVAKLRAETMKIEREIEIARAKAPAEIVNINMDTVKKVADAEAAEEGTQLQAYAAFASGRQQQKPEGKQA